MKILVYDGNPDYGGHQVMARHGITTLASIPGNEVICMLHPDNRKLALHLPESAHLKCLTAPCKTVRFQGLRNAFSKKSIQQLAKRFKDLEVDLVLCIQGEIEDSSQALLAAKQAQIECVSYLAIPHPMQLMNAKLGHVRDHINRYLFTLPDRYIVISESMKQLLRARGATAPIQIVQNGIPAPPNTESKSTSSPTTLGMFGRIEFNQKRQDFMVKSFCSAPEFKNHRLLIAGNGPDKNKLKQQVKKSARANDIQLMPWQNQINDFYSQIDLLMLPSRFEGVPLVMLEALARGLPVVASRRDGMKDLLPEEWTFEPGDAAEMATAFAQASSAASAHHIERLRTHVLTEMSITSFSHNFVQAVMAEGQ